MNKRRMDIINDLANLERTSTLAVLTEKYGVSTRTIRSDLGAINEILEKGGLSPVELRRGGEIHCGLDFVGILELVDVEDYYEYRLSREERIRIAATLMVQSADYITLSAIAEHLFVIRATVIEDLDEIKNLIRRGGLEVISSPNKGQRVVGKESAKRLVSSGSSGTGARGRRKGDGKSQHPGGKPDRDSENHQRTGACTQKLSG